MTLSPNDPITQLAFSVHENRGVYAVLLGSGISRAAEIPTGWDITLDLVRRVAMARGVQEQPDWEKWYREDTGEEPNYSRLLEELADTPTERRAVLHRYLEPDSADREAGRKTPTKAHYAIAELVQSGNLRVIITTNFDRLMENALRERGVEPTVVSSADSLSGAEPLTHSRCYLLKLHGDYKDSRILNTDQELSSYPDEYGRLLDRIFDEYGLIICGWSGEWDHALRSVFLRAPNRRYSVYWAIRGSLGERAQELAAHRSARTIPITDADHFFESLQRQVETLNQYQRQNPLSVDMLVNSAKRFLAKPEHRIQLDELFSHETERLLEQLDGEMFSLQESWNEEAFRLRVGRYESITEPLARMVGVLGRWGDDEGFLIVRDVLRNLYHHATKLRGGQTGWLDLRSYPAVLVFTAYGIGLTRAARWKVLHDLFSMILTFERSQSQKVVATLFLSNWAASNKQVWQSLDGLANRKTPLSDHLHEVMNVWRSSFVGGESNFELLFERFELLGSLAGYGEKEEAELEAEASRQRHFPLARMPMGRVGWHKASAQILLEELQESTFVNELLKAGFAKSSPRFLELFALDFSRHSDKMDH